nr:cytochrome c biogenesis protein ResB [FCB group bacterium]
FPVNTNIPDWKEVYSEKYGAVFDIMQVMGLQNPYRSWWYTILLGLLSVSLTLCIIDQAPKAFNRLFSYEFKNGGEEFRALENRDELLIGNETADGLERQIKGYHIRRKEAGDRILFSAVKGRLGYLGPLFTHLGMLLLVIGGLIVGIAGFESFGEAYPGEFIENEAFDFKIKVEDFRIEYHPLGAGQWVLVDDERFGRIKKRLKDDKFLLEFFAQDSNYYKEINGSRLKNKFNIERDRGNIKDYISTLTVVENGESLFTKEIEVNKPLRYKGFRFYQSSFNTRNPQVKAEADSAVIVIKPSSGKSKIDTLKAAFDSTYPLPNGDSFKVVNFIPDFRITPQGVISQSDNLRNPAVEVKVFRNGEERYHQWCFLEHPAAHSSSQNDYSFRVLDLINPRAETVFSTILQIKKSLGVPVIWAGLIMMTLGVFLAFYITPKRIWIVLHSGDNESRLEIAGYTSRGKHLFKEEFERIVDKITSTAK